MNPRTGGVRLLVVLALLPTVAHAHLVNSGLGPFYDGMLHLLLSPGDLLGLLAAALLAGLRGRRASRLTVLVMPAAWLLFGLVGLNLSTSLQLNFLSVLSFVILGALVALDPKRLPEWAVAALAGSFGALHGLLNGSALSAIGAGVVSLLGIVATVFVITLIVASLVVPLRRAWTRIAVRVAGSWVTAVGILMLGWLLQGA